jgi:hypothetical protein
MLPLWLVYILVVILVVLDVLFVAGVIVVGVFLVAYILFNIATALFGRKVDRYIKARLDRMRQEAGATSENRSKAVGHAKTVYSIAFLLYRIYDITTSLVIGFVAFVLLVLGSAGLAIVNVALFWLLNAYIL